MDKLSLLFVSVIIPVYNDPIRLKMCLQALEEQTYPKSSYEVIVVDNGSSESIEPVVSEFNQAKASFEPQSGSFIARNAGISLARGEVIGFLDSDCIPASDWIEKGVTNLLSIPNCGIVGGKVEIFFKDPGHPTAAELYDSIMHLNQKRYIEKLKFSATANLFTFKHVFDHVGAFTGNQNSLDDSDDREWGQRVTSFGYKLVYADDVRVAHPARYSFAQLRQKVKRIVIGNAGLERRNRSSIVMLFNRDFLTGLVPPLLTMIRRKLGISQQIKVLLMWSALKYIEIQERVRVILWEK